MPKRARNRFTLVPVGDCGADPCAVAPGIRDLKGNFPFNKWFSLAYRFKEENNSIIRALQVYPQDRSLPDRHQGVDLRGSGRPTGPRAYTASEVRCRHGWQYFSRRRSPLESEGNFVALGTIEIQPAMTLESGSERRP